MPVPAPTAADTALCPNCGQPVSASAAFCEACGATLVPTEPAVSRPPSPTEGSAQTRRLGVRQSQVTTCSSCGGTIDADGYCQVCGAKAPSARDHYSETPADWVGGVCDRGVQHSRNEDAMALWAAEDRAVLVVCDGVSTSVDSDAASTAAAQAIRDVLVERLAKLSDPDQAAAELAAAFVDAAAAANAAVIAVTSPNSTNAASATLAAAVVLGEEVHFANLGDSRVYFLSAADPVLLSLDDSMAQAFIARGMDRAEAEALPRAHAITKWLGRDATDIVPRTGVHTAAEPGWVVVCSDGLWNYASAPADLATQLAAAGSESDDPVAVAAKLVEWANAQGGRDNITVALARCPAPAMPTNLESATPRVPEVEEQVENG
ncbi:MAG: protein phosphatase 2C domain-containing protein [Actinobacteria bacterium]|nr:protein phosphatase 2C domain-containing protein [Actinomycetota bacterium]MBU4588467.1 protein phosphatase 2C domain-containing protein [Actinomycetota bacterium]